MTGSFPDFPNSMFGEPDNGSLTSYDNIVSPLSQANHRHLMPASQMANGEAAGYHYTPPTQHTPPVQHTPSTQQLFQNWQCASETSNRITMLYQNSLQENTELRSKVRDLEAQLAKQHFQSNLYVSEM